MTDLNLVKLATLLHNQAKLITHHSEHIKQLEAMLLETKNHQLDMADSLLILCNEVKALKTHLGQHLTADLVRRTTGAEVPTIGGNDK